MTKHGFYSASPAGHWKTKDYINVPALTLSSPVLSLRSLLKKLYLITQSQPNRSRFKHYHNTAMPFESSPVTHSRSLLTFKTKLSTLLDFNTKDMGYKGLVVQLDYNDAFRCFSKAPPLIKASANSPPQMSFEEIIKRTSFDLVSTVD